MGRDLQTRTMRKEAERPETESEREKRSRSITMDTRAVGEWVMGLG